MKAKKVSLFDKIFKNKDGAIIIWQNPNIPLWGWIVSSILGVILKHGAVHSGFQHLAEASLFTWAYLELRSGESIFRRVLGAIVLVSVAYGFFKS